MGDPSFWAMAAFPLTVSYLILTIVVIFQISRILYYRHNLYSFQLGFLVLCLVWGILRSIFFSVITVVKSDVVLYTLQWLPMNLQFATFSLLVLFYAHLVHRATWETSTKKIFTVIYFVTNFIFISLQVVLIGLNAHEKIPYDNTTDTVYDKAQLYLSAVVFLILVFILGCYGWMLFSTRGNRSLIQQVPSQIFLVTVVILALFSSRSIFDFINAEVNLDIPVKTRDRKEGTIVFLLYFFWEILPTIMIILLFWHIPTTHIGGLPRRMRKDNTYNLPYPPNAGQPAAKDPASTAGFASRLFSDPQRYDSDDETTSFLRKGSPISYTQQSAPRSFGQNAPYLTTPTVQSDK